LQAKKEKLPGNKTAAAWQFIRSVCVGGPLRRRKAKEELFAIVKVLLILKRKFIYDLIIRKGFVSRLRWWNWGITAKLEFNEGSSGRHKGFPPSLLKVICTETKLEDLESSIPDQKFRRGQLVTLPPREKEALFSIKGHVSWQ
jgi:hypothetical protein